MSQDQGNICDKSEAAIWRCPKCGGDVVGIKTNTGNKCSSCQMIEKVITKRLFKDYAESNAGSTGETSASFGPCRRCGESLLDSETCPQCGMPRIDPHREAEVGKHIYQMRRIHELEREMTDIQLSEWIAHGLWILRRGKESSAGIMGG